MKRTTLLLTLTLCAGCPIELQPAAEECASEGPGDAGEGLTWHRDIAPIFAERCMSCHEGNGPGPLTLTTFSEVIAAKAAVHHAVEERHMPPWPPAACCSEYRHNASLTPDELAKVHTWFETGTMEGVMAAPPPVIRRGGLPRVDLTLTMSEPYLPSPSGSNDETRCFLIDWPETETKYVTGLDIRAGVPGQMHHSIAFVAGPEDVKTLTTVDAASPGPGWPCPGGVLGSFKDALGGSTFAPTQFDEGLGHQVLPGDKIVLQMHYSAPRAGDFKPDQSSLLLRFQSEPTKRLTTLMVYNPAWLIPQGMRIAAGQTITYSYADEPTRWAGGKPFTLHSVNLHMHERGVRGQVAILRADGTRECLLQIDAWDHMWQGDYTFLTPKRIARGDRILVSCTFDNSEANQKIVRGERQPAVDLDWSEQKEMCVAFVTASQG
jgi:hypothetical protein